MSLGKFWLLIFCGFLAVAFCVLWFAETIIYRSYLTFLSYNIVLQVVTKISECSSFIKLIVPSPSVVTELILVCKLLCCSKQRFKVSQKCLFPYGVTLSPRAGLKFNYWFYFFLQRVVTCLFVCLFYYRSWLTWSMGPQ